MLVWPATLPPPDLPFTESREDQGKMSEVVDGPTISRQTKTKSRKTFRLNWENIPLSIDEYNALDNFLAQTRGSVHNFSWTHPVTHTSYTVKCIEIGEFRWAVDGNPGWSGGIVIKEV
jgi:hypothetical protein